MENKCEHRIGTLESYYNNYGLVTEKQIIDIFKRDIDGEYRNYIESPEEIGFNFCQTEFLESNEVIWYEFLDFCPDCGKHLDCDANFDKINNKLSRYVKNLPKRTKEDQIKARQKIENDKKRREIEIEEGHTGFVYLIKLGNYYKIGITRNTKNRFNAFKFMPFKFEVIKTAKVKDYENVEVLLHQMFKDYQIKGEWFNLTDENVNYIIDYLTELEV